MQKKPNSAGISFNESESGVEASMSSIGDEEDEDDQVASQMQQTEPSPLKKAVRSARRSARHGEQTSDNTSYSTDFMVEDDRQSLASNSTGAQVLSSLSKEERDLTLAGLANVTRPSASESTSSTASDTNPIRDIPTPSSGYEGDTEGAASEQRNHAFPRYDRLPHRHLPRQRHYQSSYTATDTDGFGGSGYARERR